MAEVNTTQNHFYESESYIINGNFSDSQTKQNGLLVYLYFDNYFVWLARLIKIESE